MSSPQLVWFITGASSGFGYELTLAALRRGDKVIATTRGQSISKLEELKGKGAETLELDVTSPIQTLREVAEKAAGIYGRIDVLVNNAGYLAVGTVEESNAEETFEQFNINVFGALNVTRAILPYMRERKSGTIVWIGSIMGWQGVPYCGQYVASKWAIRGIAESIRLEVESFGIRSVCLDYGYFRTPVLTSSQRTSNVRRINDYKPLVDTIEGIIESMNGNQPGDPLKGVEAIIDIVKSEGLASGKPFPNFVTVGSDCYKAAKDSTEKALANLEEWKDFSSSTDFST